MRVWIYMVEARGIEPLSEATTSRHLRDYDDWDVIRSEGLDITFFNQADFGPTQWIGYHDNRICDGYCIEATPSVQRGASSSRR